MKGPQFPDRGKTKSIYQRCRPQYDAVIHKVNRKLRKLLVKSGINYTMKFRVKSFSSFFSKLLKVHNTSNPFITDILGLRIISPFLEDLEAISDLIEEHFQVVDVERKGSIHSFREFGYDSIHLLIDLDQFDLPCILPNTQKVCEIQLRTILQEAWAEVEHELVYKAEFTLLNEPVKRKLASLNATLSLSDIIFQEIRDYQKEVQMWGEKRRIDLQEKLYEMDGLSYIDTHIGLEALEKSETSKVQINHKNRLEKIIFEALNAHSKNQFNKALKLYTKILGMRPQTHIRSIIYNHRGMVYFVQSEYRRAIHDFSKAVKYNPQNYRAMTNRGLCFRIVQNYDRALEEFRKSLAIDDTHIEAYYSRALTYYDIHDFSQALSDCDRVLNINPNFVPAKHLRKLINNRLFNQ